MDMEEDEDIFEVMRRNALARRGERIARRGGGIIPAENTPPVETEEQREEQRIARENYYFDIQRGRAREREEGKAEEGKRNRSRESREQSNLRTLPRQEYKIIERITPISQEQRTIMQTLENWNNNTDRQQGFNEVRDNRNNYEASLRDDNVEDPEYLDREISIHNRLFDDEARARDKDNEERLMMGGGVLFNELKNMS